ncbi:MAG TPA: polysaccharide deacetylase family protein [Firmicutes bacterium]|nr:polysaccharide deacetylase family protein [Bacillota bacterium]
MASLEVLLRIGIYVLALVIFTFLFWYIIQVLGIRSKRRAVKFALFILSLILAIGSLLGIFTFYVYNGIGHQPDIYRSGNRSSNMVALTFDDGPSPEFTPAILDILKEYNVPATFFMVGAHVEKYPEIAQRIVDEGHEVGNHTYNHRNIPTLSTVDLHKELLESTAAITAVTGAYPTYVRPPRGMYDGRFRRLANLLGQEIVLWTVSTRDWRYGVTVDSIVKTVKNRVRGGDILLFHDSGALIKNEGGDRRATVLALPEVIKTIQAKGLQIVPLSILLHEAPTEMFPQVDMPE